MAHAIESNTSALAEFFVPPNQASRSVIDNLLLMVGFGQLDRWGATRRPSILDCSPIGPGLGGAVRFPRVHFNAAVID